MSHYSSRIIGIIIFSFLMSSCKQCLECYAPGLSTKKVCIEDYPDQAAYDKEIDVYRSSGGSCD